MSGLLLKKCGSCHRLAQGDTVLRTQVVERKEMDSGRLALLYRLGILTLLSQPLDCETSNGSLGIRCPQTTKHCLPSLLVRDSYSRCLCDHDVWGDQCVLECCEATAELGLRICGNTCRTGVGGYDHDFTERNSA